MIKVFATWFFLGAGICFFGIYAWETLKVLSGEVNFYFMDAVNGALSIAAIRLIPSFCVGMTLGLLAVVMTKLRKG